MQFSRRLFPVCLLLFLLLARSPLFAKDGELIQVGRSISVAQNEAVGDLVCIGCSVHMEGSCDDLVVIGGGAAIDGDVQGTRSLFLDRFTWTKMPPVGRRGHRRRQSVRHPNATSRATFLQVRRAAPDCPGRCAAFAADPDRRPGGLAGKPKSAASAPPAGAASVAGR